MKKLTTCLVVIFGLLLVPASASAKYCGKISDPWGEYVSDSLRITAYHGMPCRVAKRWARIAANNPCWKWVGPRYYRPDPNFDDDCTTWRTWRRHDLRWVLQVKGGVY